MIPSPWSILENFLMLEYELGSVQKFFDTMSVNVAYITSNRGGQCAYLPHGFFKAFLHDFLGSCVRIHLKLHRHSLPLRIDGVRVDWVSISEAQNNARLSK